MVSVFDGDNPHYTQTTRLKTYINKYLVFQYQNLNISQVKQKHLK